VRYLSLIITIPIVLIAVSFSVTNRELMTLGLWPLPFTLEVPAFLAILVALVGGFVVGGFVVWLGQGRHRRRARMETARATRLERDLDAANARARTAEQRVLDVEARPGERSRQVEESGGKLGGPAEPPHDSLPTVH
jgi:lipopolysaccharide assembly protein A